LLRSVVLFLLLLLLLCGHCQAGKEPPTSLKCNARHTAALHIAARHTAALPIAARHIAAMQHIAVLSTSSSVGQPTTPIHSIVILHCMLQYALLLTVPTRNPAAAAAIGNALPGGACPAVRTLLSIRCVAGRLALIAAQAAACPGRQQQPAALPAGPQQQQPTGQVTPADAAGSTAAQAACLAAVEPLLLLLLHVWLLLVCALAAAARQQVQVVAAAAAAAAAAAWLVELYGCYLVPLQA
jgi:hypothetical protein